MPLRPGALISTFRAWCDGRVGGADWWASYLSGAKWPRLGGWDVGLERLSSARHPFGSLDEISRMSSPGCSTMALAITGVAHAMMAVLQQAVDYPIGVRLNLRPPEVLGSFRMIGLATLEAPIRFDPASGLDDATSVAAAVGQAREHGHIGEVGIRESIACPPDAGLFEILIVPETEPGDDEWAVRGGSGDAWREVRAWRREVSPSRITAYIHVDGAAISVRVSGVGVDVETLATEVAREARSLLLGSRP